MIRLTPKLKTKKYTFMKWNMQTGNITTNTKVKIYLILPKFSAAKIVNQECHIDDSVKGIYDMILVKYILP